MSPARDDRTAPRARLTLETPIQFVKGVGERRAELMHRIGIHTAGDLLYHVPHRYEDASTITSIATVQPGMDVTILGRVISKGVLPTRRGLRIFQAVLKDDTGMIEVSWPGQPFLDRSIDKGHLLLVSGPCRFYHGRQVQPREYVNFGAEEDGAEQGRVLAVYRATEGITVRQIRALIEQHLDTRCVSCTAPRRSVTHTAAATGSRSMNCCSCRSCSVAPTRSRVRHGRASRSGCRRRSRTSCPKRCPSSSRRRKSE